MFGDTSDAEKTQNSSAQFFCYEEATFFFLVLVCAMSSFAQTSMMATLNHEGTIPHFMELLPYDKHMLLQSVAT